MLKWSRAYAADRTVQVDYQSTGSGNGIQQVTVGTIDFGCTDAPLNAEQRAKAKSIHGDVIHIPMVMGGVVPVYNLPGLPDAAGIRFDSETLGGIFLGTIERWNDPALKALNPGANLPDQRILVVTRSDPSGTTAIFADYVSKVCPKLWTDKSMGKPGTAVRWPTGEAQKGNEGVAGLIARVPGSIGYVELKYAEDVGLAFGSVRNKSGAFVKASPKSVQAAAAAALVKIPDDMCFSLTNPPGADSYPISGTVWAVFYRDLPDDRRRMLTPFLRWAIGPGQEHALKLGYAPLPQALVARVAAELDSLEGKPR
ncbi:MAG: phosphate ABC transporter substrate-binding protein PstS [Gemmataceae bacterium]|nr:phosphate ABC transporter substrate-binding protein PstS [Gemmataceae bacterium]